MERSIVHEAEVVGVGVASLTLRFVGAPSCGGCALAGVCGSADETLTVSVDNAADFAPGDMVIASASRGTRSAALWLCVLLPCMLLVGVIALAVALGAGEAIAACAGIGAVGAWFAVMYLLRGRLAGVVKWTVKHSVK